MEKRVLLGEIETRSPLRNYAKSNYALSWTRLVSRACKRVKCYEANVTNGSRQWYTRGFIYLFFFFFTPAPNCNFLISRSYRLAVHLHAVKRISLESRDRIRWGCKCRDAHSLKLISRIKQPRVSQVTGTN